MKSKQYGPRFRPREEEMLRRIAYSYGIGTTSAIRLCVTDYYNRNKIELEHICGPFPSYKELGVKK